MKWWCTSTQPNSILNKPTLDLSIQYHSDTPCQLLAQYRLLHLAAQEQQNTETHKRWIGFKLVWRGLSIILIFPMCNEDGLNLEIYTWYISALWAKGERWSRYFNERHYYNGNNLVHLQSTLQIFQQPPPLNLLWLIMYTSGKPNFYLASLSLT